MAVDPDYGLLLRTAIRSHLQSEERIHADDLHYLDIPRDRLNQIGLAFARLVRAGYIFEVGRRASTNPASHNRKSGIFMLTARGEARLAGSSDTGKLTDSAVARSGRTPANWTLSNGWPGAALIADYTGAEPRWWFEAIEPAQGRLVA